MNTEIKTAIDKILKESASWKDTATKLVCFCPMRGGLADGRLMLVGRSLYGWSTTPFKAPEMEFEARREEILENTWEFSSWDGGCPIQKLHTLWDDGLREKNSQYKYNPKKSSFWQVTKQVARHFGSPTDKGEWLNYLYWTNLYKLSFKDGRGTPPKTLKDVTGAASLEMLTTEINLLSPKRILLLTGQWWADPFLKSAHYTDQELEGYAHVYQTGHWSLGNGGKAAVVVADHPERKKRSVIVSEILDAFGKLG